MELKWEKTIIFQNQKMQEFRNARKRKKMLSVIFNEAIKYDSFNEIIHMTSYQTTFYDKDGKAKELTVNNTNPFC